MPFDYARSRGERAAWAEISEKRRLMEARQSKWREYYKMRTRNEGSVKPGCGGPKREEEQRKMAKYPGRCSECGGKFLVGDWIFWSADTKKVRHAPSGWKKPDAT